MSLTPHVDESSAPCRFGCRHRHPGREHLGYYETARATWFEAAADEIEKMRRRLEGCSAKVPIETYLGAKKFIEHFSAAKLVWNSKVGPA